MRTLLEVRRRAQVDRLLEWIGAGGRPPARRVALAAPLLALVAIAIAAALLSGGGGDSASADESGAPTAPVERRDLAQRASVDGTLGYAGSAEVITRMAGTVTWLPAAGSVIGRGERLLAVDGEPVLLMYGSVPAYRDLASGVSDGADVRELERNLSVLGYDTGEVDDTFTSTSAGAVAEWQDELGLEQTGEVELGRVVFLSGERRVSSLDVSLGSDTGSAAGASGNSGVTASYDGPETPTGFASMSATGSDTGADQGPSPKKKQPSHKPSGGSGGSDGNGSGGGITGAGGAARDSDPAAAAPSSSPAAQDPSAAEGSGAGADESAPATQVMTTTSTRRVVTVALDTADLSLAKRGRQARITFPSGQTTRGRISSVGTVAESSSDEGTDSAAPESDSTASTVDVTIALTGKDKIPNLEDAPVTVELIEELRRDVLAVPVAALVGTAGGEYAVVVSDAEGRRQLPVEVGLFADGFVEVEGDGLTEGMEVEVPEGL